MAQPQLRGVFTGPTLRPAFVNTSAVDALDVVAALGLRGSWYAAPVGGGTGIGLAEHALVSPASVMKVQVALAVETLVATGRLDGSERRVMLPAGRTPGPTGISLMLDEVTMSVRDLVLGMLTISDNAATDELIGLVGLEQLNWLLTQFGMERTVISSDLRQMLEQIATDAGFATYAALVEHDPTVNGPPSADEIRHRVAQATALDPTRATRTTAAEMVALLQAIWSDAAAPAQACRRVREAMGRQLAMTRIASGFDHTVQVAVFTRKDPGSVAQPGAIDAAIGRIARSLVDELRSRDGG